MLLLCLGVALPLLAIGSFSIWKQYSSLQDEASRATSFQAAIAARTLTQWTASQLNSLEALSNLSQVKSLDLPASHKILSTALAAQKEWEQIILVKADGTTLQVVAAPGTHVSTFPTSSTRGLIERCIKGKKAIVSDYQRSPWTTRPALFALSPVTVDGSVKAVLLAAINPDSVWRVFDGLTKDNGTVITIVDANQRVITRTIKHEYWQGKDYSQAKCVQAASKARRGNLEVVGIADPTPRAYAFEHATPNNWLVIVGVPTDAIYGAAYDWLFFMGLLTIGAIAISVVLAFSVTSHFTSTIHVLVKEALSVGKGDFTKRVHVPARDEFGLLARAFNEMADMLLFDKEHKTMVQAISSQIRQSLDLDDILNTTVRELGSHLEASRCCLAILDTHRTPNVCDDELAFNYVWFDESRGGTELQNQSILITDTSVLRTILEQGSIMSLDILESEQTPLFENASPDEWKSIRSLIACPISTKNGPLGMILVHQCDRLRLWTNSELELVEAVASQVTVALEHGRLYDRSRRMAEQEILINHIVRSVRSSLDLDTILNTVTRELLHALGVERVQIAQPKGDNPLMITHEFTVGGYESGVGVSMYSDNMDFTPKDTRRHARSTVRNTVLGINLEGLLDGTGSDEEETPVNKQVSLIDQSTTLREAPIAIINDTEFDSRCMPFRPFVEQLESRALIAAPLLHESRLVGLLIVHQCSGSRAWKTSDVALVTAIADQLAIAITHASLFAQVRYQAITDGLTGLYNHVYFKNRLKEELKLADRKGTSCSLIMIDLDKLKYINDNFGHPIGDAAIRQVASILKTMLRSGDTAARYGGEEFAVILPETSLLEAALIADRLCTRIRNSHVTGLGRITASLGAASYPKQAITMEELVEKADRAMYKSKNSGRDQANIYEPDEVVNEVISLAAPGPMPSGSMSSSEPGANVGGSVATLPSSNSAVSDKPTAQMIDVPLIDIQIQSAEDSFAVDPLQERPGT